MNTETTISSPVSAEPSSGKPELSKQSELDPGQFPHPPRRGKLPVTIENVEHLLKGSSIEVGFDQISKRMAVRRYGKLYSVTSLASEAGRYGLAGTWLLPFVEEISRRNPLNPVRDWIDSMPWDGVDRLQDLVDTIKTAEGYPEGLKVVLINRWMLAATAAATLEGKRFATRGVLTLQGPQGSGKTSWITRLMPPGNLRDTVIKRDHHMDGGNKDSIIGAIRHWIVEIGELDSTFRKDIARLKGFLTNDCDKLRPPYGREEIDFDRRTVFAATVNEGTFLVDPTGNSRFWTIAVESIDYGHSIDMQQVFAQMRSKLRDGEQWWLKPAEEQALTAYNQRHQSVSAIAERVQDHIEMDAIGKEVGIYRTASQVLSATGLTNPSNRQCKECASALRDLLGEPKRVQGRDRWRVPLKGDRGVPSSINLADEEY